MLRGINSRGSSISTSGADAPEAAEGIRQAAAVAIDSAATASAYRAAGWRINCLLDAAWKGLQASGYQQPDIAVSVIIVHVIFECVAPTIFINLEYILILLFNLITGLF